MSRSQGAYAHFYIDPGLEKLIRDIASREEDLSPVMAPISKLIQEELIARLGRGGDDWEPFAKSTLRRPTHRGPGIGAHGGFASTVRRSWSKRNAVAFTQAPHAHLFDEGTARHVDRSGKRVNVYSAKRRRVSRPESRRRSASSATATHEPARPFAYVSPALGDRAGAMILDFLLEGLEGRS
jgi:hypothetical protein